MKKESHQSKKTGRVTHTVDIDQILVSPVLTKRDSIGKSVVLSHTVTSSGVLGTTDCLCERHIHHIFVQLPDRHLSRDEVVSSGRIGENDSFVDIGRVRGHLNQSVTLVLSKETGRRRTATSSGTTPEYVVRLVLPLSLHVIDVLNNHVDRIPTISVSLSGGEIVVTGNKNVAVSQTLGWREHGVKSMDSPPIGEEMALIIMSPGVSAKVVFVVDTLGEEKVFRRSVGSHTSIGETRDGSLTFFEIGTERTKQTTGLR